MVPSLAAEGGVGTYLDWGVVHISLANFLIIVLMIVVFVAALFIPFPRGQEDDEHLVPQDADRTPVDR